MSHRHQLGMDVLGIVFPLTQQRQIRASERPLQTPLIDAAIFLLAP